MNVPASKLAMWMGILILTAGFYIGFTSPNGTLSLAGIGCGLVVIAVGANMMAREEEERSQQSMQRFMAMIENSDEVKQAKEERSSKSEGKAEKKRHKKTEVKEKPSRTKVKLEKQETAEEDPKPRRSRKGVPEEAVSEEETHQEEGASLEEERPARRERRSSEGREKKKRASKGRESESLEDTEEHREEEEEMIKFPLGKKPEQEPPELRPSRSRVQAENYTEEDGQPRSRFRPRGGQEESARKYVPREREEVEEEEEFAPVRTRPRRREDSGEMHREKVDYEEPLVQAPCDLDEESPAMRFRRRAEEGAVAPPRARAGTSHEEESSSVEEEYTEEERLQAMKMGVDLSMEAQEDEEEVMEALSYTEEERLQAEKLGIDLEAERLAAEEKIALRQEEKAKKRRQAILERQEVEVYDGTGIQKRAVTSTRVSPQAEKRKAVGLDDSRGAPVRRSSRRGGVEETAGSEEVYQEEAYEEVQARHEEVYEEDYEEVYEEEVYEKETHYSQEELNQALKMGLSIEDLDATLEEDLEDHIHTDVMEYLPEEVDFALHATLDMDALNAQFEQELREEHPEMYQEEEMWEEELVTGVHVAEETEGSGHYTKEERLQAMKMGISLEDEEEEDWEDEEVPIPLTPEEMLQAAKMGLSFAEMEAMHRDEDSDVDEYEESDVYEEQDTATSYEEEDEEDWEEKRPVRRTDAQEESWKEQQKALAEQLSVGLPGSATRKPIEREDRADNEVALRGKPKLMMDEEPVAKKTRKTMSKGKTAAKEDLSQFAGTVMPTEDDYDYEATPKVSFQSRRREEGASTGEETGKAGFRSRKPVEESGTEGKGLFKKKR